MAAEEEDDGGGEEGAPAWMATFADLATLLLTFFVLLLSFANMDVQNFRMALGSIKDAFGVQFDHKGSVSALATSVVELSKKESSDDIKLLEMDIVEQIEMVIEEAGLQDKIDVMAGEVGIIVRVTDQVLFPTGSDVLVKGAHRIMDVIAKLTDVVPYPIWIEGHTDDNPINTLRFPSNWELSTARAAAAMRYLVERREVPPERVRIAGYAHFRPLKPNDSVKGRRKNRRVEFVFMKMGEGKKKIGSEDLPQNGPGQLGPSLPAEAYETGGSPFFPDDE